MSEVSGTLSVMVRYDIAALLSRFDVRAETQTALTGKLSSLLGESLLLSALARFLKVVQGHEVEVLGDRPHRDDTEFPDDPEDVPRDLDAWLLLDGEQLAAVECEHWTSSSRNYRSVPGDSEALADHARAEWECLVREHFVPLVWDKVNKVALPLKPPERRPSASTADARRILAVWTQVSKDGRSCLSTGSTTTFHRGELAGIEVEVFSASMYLRALLAAGTAYLEAKPEDMERVLAALRAVIEVRGLSAVW